ncbi:MAG TPA: hypothetical protein DCG57_10985 [Candidatus Riflebacteria bacterium]|nr:hypothetical protein [Candidatus Riflebacteria bacterium]
MIITRSTAPDLDEKKTGLFIFVSYTQVYDSEYEKAVKMTNKKQRTKQLAEYDFIAIRSELISNLQNIVSIAPDAGNLLFYSKWHSMMRAM